MTVSFHQYGNGFFPNSGHALARGVGLGKNYALNVPLRPGIDDDTYNSLFHPVMKKVLEVFNPGAIILQCGSDSLAYDLLGELNLSSKGHGGLVD